MLQIRFGGALEDVLARRRSEKEDVKIRDGSRTEKGRGIDYEDQGI